MARMARMARRLTDCMLLLCLVALLTLASPRFTWAAEPVEMQDFLARVQDASDRVSSFVSRFSQEKHLAMFDKPVQFTGRLAIIRPDKLRWEFTEPVPSVLIFNGNEGIRCSDQAMPEHFSLKTDPVMRLVAEQLWYWLGGNYQQMSQRYDLSFEAPAILEITPKEASEAEYLKRVRISFDADSLQPQRVEIVEGGDDVTSMVFIDPQVNTNPPQDAFTSCGVDFGRDGTDD